MVGNDVPARANEQSERDTRMRYRPYRAHAICKRRCATSRTTPICWPMRTTDRWMKWAGVTWSVFKAPRFG